MNGGFAAQTAGGLGAVTLGTNVFGWTVGSRDAGRILEEFVAAGGRHIDTADAYPSWAPGCSGGESESAIGAWQAEDPERRGLIRIGTKIGMLPGFPGLSAQNIEACVAASLKRLQVDQIDLLYFHADDADTDMAQSVRAVAEEIGEGRVAEFGVSNYSAERLESLLKVCDRLRAPRPVAYQGQYHLLNRGCFERHLSSLLQAEQIAFMPHSSLANGFLTGKYLDDPGLSGARSGSVARYFTEAGRQVARTVREVAEAHATASAAVALAWARSRPNVVVPAVSVSSLTQLADVMTVVELTDEDIDRLDAVSAVFVVS